MFWYLSSKQDIFIISLLCQGSVKIMEDEAEIIIKKNHGKGQNIVKYYHLDMSCLVLMNL